MEIHLCMYITELYVSKPIITGDDVGDQIIINIYIYYINHGEKFQQKQRI